MASGVESYVWEKEYEAVFELPLLGQRRVQETGREMGSGQKEMVRAKGNGLWALYTMDVTF